MLHARVVVEAELGERQSAANDLLSAVAVWGCLRLRVGSFSLISFMELIVEENPVIR